MLRFAGGGVSDVGRVRPHNEDAAFLGIDLDGDVRVARATQIFRGRVTR